MTRRCNTTITTGRNSSGHAVAVKSDAPTYASVIPMYIGFRVAAYGPVLTNAEASRFGSTEGFARRNVRAPERASPPPPAKTNPPTKPPPLVALGPGAGQR